MSPEKRADQINEIEGPKIRALVREAVALADSRRVPQNEKAERLLDIAERLSRTIVPHTPCAKGCSHCCHMATVLSGYEARMIGRYIGREPRRLGREAVASFNLDAELQERYKGVPCPMLEDGRCSVYPVRPIACRVHHTVEEDETFCKIVPGESIKAARLNLNPLTIATALILLTDDYGDIREFFP